MPADTPLTKPLEEPTLATAVLELTQIQPVESDVAVTDEPTQILSCTAIADGCGNTVMVRTTIQPVQGLYVITTVPAVWPIKMPVVGRIEPTVVSLLLHVPHGVASLATIVFPTQTLSGPVIGAAVGVTVIVFIAWQPKQSR